MKNREAHFLLCCKTLMQENDLGEGNSLKFKCNFLLHRFVKDLVIVSIQKKKKKKRFSSAGSSLECPVPTLATDTDIKPLQPLPTFPAECSSFQNLLL